MVIQNDNWFSTYGTQFFAVDQVNGTIYAIKDDGQWELTKEKATIDTDTHHIVMSTTPILLEIKWLIKVSVLVKPLLVRQNKLYL